MKKVIVTLLTLLTINLTTKSQNGGQHFENNVIKVLYKGYFNGEHVAEICNKQNCEARIRTKADQDPAIDIQVPANGCVVIKVTRPTATTVLFRAKAETSCPNFTNPDMGWLEVNFISPVLNLVQGNYVRIPFGNNIYEVKLVGTILKSDFGNSVNVQRVEVYNMTGRNLFNQKIRISSRHEIDLRSYLTIGINFIVITIDDRKYSRYVFQTIVQ